MLFHTVHGVLKARILKWFAILFSSGPHSVRPLHHDSPVLGGPTQHCLISLSQTRLSSKVRSRGVLFWSSHEKIPHYQGKRNPSKMVGVARGHQRADTLKPYSQKISQSNHTRTTASSNSMKPSHACRATQDGRVWWRGLTECGPLEKGMASHFNILALRTP